MLTASSLFIAGLLIAAPSPTQAAETVESSSDADARARVGETNIYEFEADDLEGRVLTAEGTQVRSHTATVHKSLINLRTSFLDRLYTHAADI